LHRSTGKFFLLAFFILLAPQYLFAQPVISYVIPDIGTPGMNTYMEIIAPHDSVGDFGVDGFYLGNRSDIIQVVCANPSDTQFVRFGPCIVSWNGRMISTQVFVLPWVQPTSSNWQNGIKIPIKVLFDGDLSNADTFYIIKPQNLDPASTFTLPGTIGSGGVWGTRSRRGSMIVDSLILAASGTYNFSTDDCDPFTEGNQGYLPFILISKGKISVASSTVLDASANKIDGGPSGGGGGDGLVCGTKGGDGFTGGGGNAHWYNSCTDAPPAGDGSGINENGLNGVLGGESSSQNEGGGGGTGHPFGIGGNAGYFQSGNSSPPGSYGGGQGGPNCCDPQEGGGGGGGFAIKGFDGGVLLNHFSGGNPIGNSELVPMAGGSGGGGGNVNAGDVSGTGAGTAGGGGGAIMLYGKTAKYIGRIQAIGADGQNSSNEDGAGGGGSGGAIVCGAKLSLSIAKVDVSGGIGGVGQPLNSGQDGGAGSPGRVRFDGPISATPSVTARATKFTGPTTDASDTVAQTFTLTGSGNGNDIQILAKPLHGQWSQVQVVSNYTKSGNLWKTTVTLPGNDSVYLLAAAEKIPNPSTKPFLNEPSWVLSQSAANILFVKCPVKGIIASDTVINFGTISLCAAVTDTIIISNIGCEASGLRDSISNPLLGLSATGAKALLPIQTKDTLILHLHPTSVGPSSTTLFILTALGNISIPVTWIGDAAASSIAVTPSVMNLGSISKCSEAFDTIVIQNLGCDSVSVSDSLSNSAFGLSILRGVRSSLHVSESDTIIVHLQPNAIGAVASRLHIHFGNRDTVIAISGDVIPGTETVSFSPSAINFGQRARCVVVYDTVYFTNTGCDSLHLSANIDDITAGAQVVRSPKSSLAKGLHDTLIIAFRPHRTGAITANILLHYQGNDSTIAISAFGVNDSTPIALSITPAIQSFQCDTKKFAITVSNPTCDSLTFTSYNISGNNNSDFTISSKTPIGLASGSNTSINGIFDPQDSGNRNAVITLHLLRGDGTTIDTSIALQAVGVLQHVHVTLPPSLPSVQTLQKVTIPILSTDSSQVAMNIFDFALCIHTDLLTPTGVEPSAGLFAGAAVDRFTVYHDSVSVRLRLASPVRIMPGTLCAINCLTYVADTLSTVVALQRTSFGDLSSTAQCLATTNVDSVSFTLDPQCGDPTVSHFLAGRLPNITNITPNPGSGEEKISYTIPISTNVRIEIFNQLGQKLRTLYNANEVAGTHTKEFDVSDLPSASYYLRIQTDGKSQMKSLELLK